MSVAFEKAVEMVIELEGGYSNDAKDPGGETKFGISKRAHPHVDIKNLSLDEAKGIYARDYWHKVHGDKLPWPLSLCVFDAAVNQGPTAAVMLLQKTLAVPQDGLIGPETLKAAAKASKETCSRFMAHRAVRYAGNANFSSYGHGWMARLFRVALKST